MLYAWNAWVRSRWPRAVQEPFPISSFRPGGLQERSKRPTGAENKRPEDRIIAKRLPRSLQEGFKTHFGAILGRILEPSRDEFGTIWGPVEELFCILFSLTRVAEHIKRTIKTGASRSASPALSGRARAQRACECPGAHAKSCWVVAIYALASLALVAASSSFALLQEPFAKESLEGAKSFPRAPDLQ